MITSTNFNSTTLAGVSYDSSHRELHLDFRDGSRYLYSAVSPDLFQRLIAAPSKGRFFNEQVRGRLPFRRLIEM
jgi:lysyl-tRNA synthetase class 2